MLNKVTFRATFITACAMLSAGAYAIADAPKRVDIPAGELSVALLKLSKQYGADLVYRPEQVYGLETHGAHGSLTTEQAVTQLLQGTMLELRTDQSGAMLIAPAASGSAQAAGSAPQTSTATPQDASDASQEGKKSSSGEFRVVQVDQGKSSSAPSIGNQAPNSQEPNSSATGLAEIIVTAQKRSQNLQDVPISISAIGGTRIEELGLQNLNDLMRQVPGVSFTSVGPGEGNLVIRGVATGEIGGFITNRSEAVGVYIDDTPVGLPRYNPDISPFDLERVEVLRGPQGTLFGSGSLAGTVRYITRKPDTHESRAKLGVDASSTERGGLNHRVDGMANIPLTDTLALRAVGYEVFDDGYIRGVGPGNTGRDANDIRQYGGRAALRWQANNDFTVDASVMIQRLRSDLSPQDNIGYAYSRGVPVGSYEQYRYSPTFQNHDFNLYNLTLEYALGWGKLLSSTSYLRDGADTATDFNGSIQQFYGVDVHAILFNPSSRKDVSEELRLATDLEGPLNFIGGVFYIHSDRWNYETVPGPGFDAAYTIPVRGVDSTAFGASVDEIFRQTVKIGERQTALFGELTYAVTQKLSATAGLRWFDVNQDYFISTAGVVSNGNPPLERPYAEHGFNPKFLVSYKVSDNALLSAQASRGFRLGGTNDRISQSLCAADLAALGLTKGPETFKSENAWNYELDAKTSWDDRRLTVNGSLYYIDYKNIQVLTSNTCGFDFVYNAAAATSKGAELELTARPLQGLEVTLGGAYTDAQLSVDVPLLRGKAGDQLPLSAKFTANATARYDFPIHASLRGFAQYGYQYTDRIIIGLGYQSNEATVAQPAPAYRLHNIRLGLADRGWEASLYLNNVLDEEVVTFSSSSRGEYLRSLGQPRTGGLNVSYKW